MAVYYAGGIAFSAVEAHRVSHGSTFASAVTAFEPWAGARARPGRARRPRRLLRLGGRVLAPDDGEPRRGPRGDQARARRVHGEDPGAGAPPQPGGARGLRAADGADGLPRRRLDLRGLPGRRDDPAARRARARLGARPARLLAVREGAAARRRLEVRARAGCRRRRCSRRRCSTAPTRSGARGSIGPPPGKRAAHERRGVPHPDQRRARRDLPRPRLAAVRPGGRRDRLEHRPLLVPARASRRRSPARSCAPARPGDALLVERPAVPVPARRAARCTPPTCTASLVRAAHSTGRAPTASTTSTAAASRCGSRARSGTQLVLQPAAPLRPGRLRLRLDARGHVRRPDFSYLRVVARRRPRRRRSRATRRPRARGRRRRCFPVAAALVAFLFAFLLVRSLLARPAGQKAFWAAGFLLFGRRGLRGGRAAARAGRPGSSARTTSAAAS